MVIVATAFTADGKERPTPLGAGLSGSADDRPSVVVHIENLAAVPPETIAGARDELAHVYDAAGIRVETSAEPDHDQCAHQLTVHVVLLGGERADRFIRRERVNRRALAQANSDARRVYVFTDRVGPAVDRHAVGRGDALGLVIAHELGHVLLPARDHARTGIMQANYNVYFSYRLKFTAEESTAMRAFIAAAR
jgi:hypothetical protein